MKTIDAVVEDRDGNVIGYCLDAKSIELATPVKRSDLEADRFDKFTQEKQLKIAGLPDPKPKGQGPELFPDKTEEAP